MSSLPLNFDWKKSYSYIILLIYFRNGYDMEKVEKLSKLPFVLQGTVSETIDMFFKEGLLEPCNLLEKIYITNYQPQLKIICEAEGLPSNGSRLQLAKRLALLFADGDDRGYSKREVYKCTQEAITIIETYHTDFSNATSTAKLLFYNHLLLLELNEAKKVYNNYLKTWYAKPSQYKLFVKPIKHLNMFFDSNKNFLINDLEPTQQRQVLSALAMETFWQKESVWNWIPNEMSLDNPNFSNIILEIKRYLFDLINQRENITLYAIEQNYNNKENKNKGRSLNDESYAKNNKNTSSTLRNSIWDQIKELRTTIIFPLQKLEVLLFSYREDLITMADFNNKIQPLIQEVKSNHVDKPLNILSHDATLDKLLAEGLITRDEYIEKKKHD